MPANPLTVSQVAAQLQLSPATVRRYGQGHAQQQPPQNRINRCHLSVLPVINLETKKTRQPMKVDGCNFSQVRVNYPLVRQCLIIGWIRAGLAMSTLARFVYI